MMMTKLRRTKVLGVAVVLAMGGMALSGARADVTWSGTPSSYSWNTTDANWTDTNAPAGNILYTDAVNVTFDDTGAAAQPIVIQGGGVNPGGVTFNNSTSNTYTLNGGAIQGGSLNVVGTGTVVLNNGANSFSAATINSGTVVVRQDGGTGTGVLTINGGTISTRQDGGTDHTVTLGNSSQVWTNGFAVAGRPDTNWPFSNWDLNMGTAPVTLGSNVTVGVTGNSRYGWAWFWSNTTLTVGGVISDGGNGYGLTKTGESILALTGNNTYTGTTAVLNGTLYGSSNAAFGNGTSDILVGDTTGSNNATLQGNGFDLNRKITIQAGNTGTAYLNAVNGNFLGNITLGSNGVGHSVALVSDTWKTTNVSGVIQDPAGLTGAGGSVIIDNYGDSNNGRAVALWSANTFKGGVILNAGTINIGNDQALGTGTFTINGGSMSAGWTTHNVGNNVVITGDSGLNGGSGNLNFNGNISVTGSRNLFVSNGSLNFNGPISNSAGSTGALMLTYWDYSATVTLAGNNTFNGGVTFNPMGNWGEAILNLNSATALGTGTFTINHTQGNLTPVVNNSTGGLVTLTTNNAQVWNADFSFGSTIWGVRHSSLDMGTGAVSLGNSGTTRTVNVNSDTLTIGGPISNGSTTTGLTKAGGGTLVLSGSNTYTGGTVVTEGTLAGNTLGLQGSISSDNTVIFDQTLGAAPIASGTFAGAISGKANVVKNNAGTVIMTGANSYTGTTTVNGGTLEATAGAMPSSKVTLNGGTYGLMGNSSGSATQTMTVNYSGNSGLTADGNTGSSTVLTVAPLAAITAGNGLTIAGTRGGVISTGDLTVSGGSATLGSGATVTGTLTVNTGSATMSNGASINNVMVAGGSATLGNGGTAGGMTVNGGSVTLGNGAITGTLAANAGTVTVASKATPTVGTVDVSNGNPVVNTADGSLVITNQLKLVGGTNVTISAGSSFKASGSSLADTKVARTLTLGGGTLAIPTAPIPVVQSFAAVGSATWTAPAGITNIRYLVVGGGGGGGGSAAGNWGCGGGGAGGLLTGTYSVDPGTAYTVTVGAGGAGGGWWNNGVNGGNSGFGTLTAGGGGGGGSYKQSGSWGNDGTVGGSGGGSGRDAGPGHNGGTGNPGGNSVTSFSNSGGSATDWGWCAAGGGGGAGSAGYNGDNDQYGWQESATCSQGGDGYLSRITGVPTYYAAGGGGYASQRDGVGGSGIGGNAGPARGDGLPGMAGTGSGGGGGGQDGSNGGAGGSGIVIVSYDSLVAGFSLPTTNIGATSSSALDLGGVGTISTLGAINLTAGATTTALTLQNGGTLTLTAGSDGHAISATGSAGQSASIVAGTGAPSLALGSGNVSVDGGVTLTVMPTISSALTKVGAGTLAVQSLPSMVAVNKGTVQMLAGSSSHVLEDLTGVSLSFANGGTLDLTNHDLFIGGGAGNLGSYLTAGGSLITSGAANSQGLTPVMALVSGKDYAAATGSRLLDGTQAVADGDLVGVATVAGDANLDGKISADDYLALDVGYLFGLTGWTHGDFAQTGSITAEDYAIIDSNYAKQNPGSAAGEIKLHTAWFGGAYTSAFGALNAPVAVPEPASLGLLAMGAVGLLGRKSRK